MAPSGFTCTDFTKSFNFKNDFKKISLTIVTGASCNYPEKVTFLLFHI